MDINDVFLAGDEDKEYSRINKETWKTFVLEESDCSYNAESNEVIICRKVSQSNVSDSGSLYDNDGDMYVFNVTNKTWAFGDKRHRFDSYLDTGTDVKHRTNFVNIGDSQVLTSLSNNKEDYSSNNGELVPIYWQYKDYGGGDIEVFAGGIVDRGTLVSRVIDLGSPEVKKSILGMVFNILVFSSNNAGFELWQAEVYVRKGLNDPYQHLGVVNGFQDGDTNVAIPIQIKHMFSPPFSLGWTQIQFKILLWHSYSLDMAINDCYFIIRSHSGEIGKASIGEDK